MKGSDKLYIDPKVIEEIASKLHKQFAGVSESITVSHLTRLAESLGARVELADFGSDSVSARVFEDKKEKGSFTIQLARNESSRRQKFSLAHEIAHIIFHKVDTTPLVEYRRPLLEYADADLLYKETQANVFASALLIPENMARQAWETVRDIDDIAEIFEVSRSAAFVRLNSLGLLEND